MRTYAQRLLETGHDIGRAAWLEAKALDAAAALTHRPAPRVKRLSSGARCAAEMGRVMADRVAATGACSEDDLFTAGFTTAQIAQHREAAMQVALRYGADREAA